MKGLFLSLLCAALLFGCGGGKNNLPKAAGVSGDIYLFMDSTQWKGKLGEVVDSVFNQEMTGLPREEGIFRMAWVDPRKMNFVLKQRKNLIFLMTLDKSGGGSQVVKSLFSPELIAEIRNDPKMYIQTYKDVYAKDQQVMFLFAQDEAQMMDKLRNNGQKLIDFFNKVENDRLTATLFNNGSITGVTKWMDENWKVSMQIPFGFKLVQNEGDFMWVRQMNSDDDRDIFVSRLDYTSTDQFKKENLIQLRDDICKTYLYEDPEKATSYLVTETEIPYKPVTLREINLNGVYAVEMRGIWRTNTHTMGGPFLAYAVPDVATGKLYYVESFIYAPSKDQRELSRQMEVVLRTFRLASAPVEAKQVPADTTK